ncbi:hypothetical protein L208DRAFT_1238715, partial [Tricholoma matsutake]
VKEREALDHRLIQWLTTASQNDHLHGVRMAVDILSDCNRAILVCTHPALLASPNTITKLLDETEEWQEEWSTLVFDVIQQYDKDIAALGVTNRESKSGPAQKSQNYLLTTKLYRLIFEFILFSFVSCFPVFLISKI